LIIFFFTIVTELESYIHKLIAGDFPRLSDINTNYNDYSTFERHASAQSTPYFQNEPVFDRLCGRPGTSMYSQTTLMSTPCNMQSQLSEHTLSATDDNLARRFTDRTPGNFGTCLTYKILSCCLEI
jgi:hypothetical protein